MLLKSTALLNLDYGATNEINKYVSLKNVEIVDLRFLKKKIYVKIKQNKKYALTKEKEWN